MSTAISIASTRYSLSSTAVVSTINVSGLIFLISLLISRPFIFGITTSETTNGGEYLANISSPSLPSDAVYTSDVNLRRKDFKTSVIKELSSTTKTAKGTGLLIFELDIFRIVFRRYLAYFQYLIYWYGDTHLVKGNR